MLSGEGKVNVAWHLYLEAGLHVPATDNVAYTDNTNNSNRYSSRYPNTGRPDSQAEYCPLHRDVQGQL